jgi:putative nucleotidyltransferase with HDIG domain
MRQVDEYIDRVEKLPPAPRVLPELLTVLNDPNIDTERVVRVIRYDPSLTANILQLCNSAYFASATPVDDLDEAVNRLGTEEIYRLVAAYLGGRVMSSAQKGYGIDQGELWKHSVAAAVAAQLMAREKGDSESVVYTATLLHDIGKIVLSEALEAEYSRLIEETERNQQSLLDTEVALLGAHHAEVGGRLLSRWRFPASLVAAVTHHHSPREAGEHEQLASYVYLGNMVAHFMGLGFGYLPFALRGRAEALQALGFESGDLPKFMIATVEKLSVIEALFRAGGGRHFRDS